MRTTSVIAAAFVAAIAFGGQAFAVDVVNEDAAAHKVKITEGDKVTEASVEAGQTLAAVCQACQIDVDGIGMIEAAGNEKVLIKDGGLHIGE